MKTLLLGLALFVPFQLVAAEDDSVYSWGAWSQGIKPAAGVVARVTPAPVEQPKVSFRPNENSAFSREVVTIDTPAIDVQLPTPAAPAAPGAPQLPNIVTVPAGTPLSDPAALSTGTQL